MARKMDSIDTASRLRSWLIPASQGVGVLGVVLLATGLLPGFLAYFSVLAALAPVLALSWILPQANHNARLLAAARLGIIDLAPKGPGADQVLE